MKPIIICLKDGNVWVEDNTDKVRIILKDYDIVSPDDIDGQDENGAFQLIEI